MILGQLDIFTERLNLDSYPSPRRKLPENVRKSPGDERAKSIKFLMRTPCDLVLGNRFKMIPKAQKPKESDELKSFKIKNCVFHRILPSERLPTK